MFEQSFALVRSAGLDVRDVVGVIANYAILSTLAGMAALVFAIAVAALLDDRPLGQFFDFSDLANKLRSGRRAATR